MIKSLLIMVGMTAATAFAGWNGTGVPDGTGDNKVNDTGNWAGGVIDGDFSPITTEGTNALVLTGNITFSEGASKVTGVSFASNSTDVAFTSVVGVAVGQTINGTGIPYNTFLIALADTNGTLSRATTDVPSGSYTLARPALNFNFGVMGSRATNVTVTLGSDEPGTPRTLAFSGRLCQSQWTLPLNKIVFSPDVALACGNPTIVTRDSGTFNPGGVAPLLTVDGSVALGNYAGMTSSFLLDGGDLTLNGVVSGVNARFNCYNSGYAGTVRFNNPSNTFSGGLTTAGGGNMIASAATVLALSNTPSATGTGAYFGLNNIRYTFAGFSERQVTDRAWNIGGNTGSMLVNNGAAPLELTGPVYNNVYAYVAQLAGSYYNRALPNEVSGTMYNGTTILGVKVQAGVWRLTNPTNAFTGSARVGNGDGATLQFTSLANAGVKSSLGAGSQLLLESVSGTAYLEHIGTNDVSSDRELRLSGNTSEGGNSALLANGLGRLTLTGVLTNALTANTSGLRTRGLFFSGSGSGTFAGGAALADVISGSNTGRVSLYKVGAGTWTISGSNFNHSGVTVARAGTLNLDYAAGDVLTAAEPGTVYTDGGTLRLVGRPAGATVETLGTLQLGASVTQYRSSRLVVDANGGDGLSLAVATLAGDGMGQKFELIDLSSSAANTVTVGAFGTKLNVVNGVVMNNATSTSDGAARATIVLRTADGYGFPALSDGSSGTLQRLSGQPALPTSGYAATQNYLLNTPGTLTPSASVAYSTLTLDTAAGELTLDLGANKLNTTSGAGRGTLLTGPNSATISGTGTTGHISATSLWFHNYLDPAATFHADFNLGVGGPHILWGGTGLSVYSGSGLGNNFHLAGSVFRITSPQTLTIPGKLFVLTCGGVFEIGADLNGTAAGDFTFAVGAPYATTTTVALYADAGLSASGADRAVNFGGGGATLMWGSNHFLTFYDGSTDYGYALKLSSPYADATVDIQNPLDLNGTALCGRIRTVEVANGSAAVDARLSGALSGNAALAKTGPGTLELTGAQAYDGPLMVMEGTVRFGADNIVTNGLAVQLRGGGLAAGAGANSLGPLELHADATLDVGDGTAALAFPDCSLVPWAGTLTITGRLLADTVRFGTDAGGLTDAQLAAIRNGGDKVGLTDAGYLYRIAAGTLISIF